MNRKTSARKRWILGSLVVAALGALGVFGLVAAQSQLPGVRLTTDPANDLRPMWSPDGARIVFFSNRDGTNDIWMMNADGSDQRQLTSGPADDRRPSWSPDGEWIVFDSDRGGNRDIWVLNVESGELIQVTNGPGHENFPAWSPDGERLAYFSYENGVLDLWVISIGDVLRGRAPAPAERVTTLMADDRRQQCTFACHTPAWSPDSQLLAYTLASHQEVWVVGADGSDPHPIGAQGGLGHFPWWTPDGRLILLSQKTNQRQETVNDVWLIEADGSNAELLFAGIPHGGPFYWHPADFDLIAFHSPRAGNFDIFTTKLNGEPVAVAEPASASEAAPAEQAAQEADAQSLGQAPAEPAADAESLPSATAPGRISGPALLWVVAVLALGGAAVGFYLRRKS